MDPFNGGEISPGPEVQTDEEILIGFVEMAKQHYTHLVVLKWVLLQIQWQ